MGIEIPKPSWLRIWRGLSTLSPSLLSSTQANCLHQLDNWQLIFHRWRDIAGLSLIYLHSVVIFFFSVSLCNTEFIRPFAHEFAWEHSLLSITNMTSYLDSDHFWSGSYRASWLYLQMCIGPMFNMWLRMCFASWCIVQKSVCITMLRLIGSWLYQQWSCVHVLLFEIIIGIGK